jgi:protein ImuB
MEGQMDVQAIFAILHKWGIHTLGQLAALDKEQLGTRLGPEAVRMWERANGRSSRLLKLIRPPESFQESFEFEREIETAEPLLFILRRFLEQLVMRLAAIYLVAKELTLQITFANSRQDEPAVAGKQIYKRVFKIPEPTNNVDLLFRMLHTHLENFRSEHPIVAVALSAEPIKPAGEQFGLFETTLRNPHQLSETLARLTALLGSDRIGTPVLEETHRPDAFRMQPFSWAVASASATVASGKEDVPSGVNRESGPDSYALRRAHATATLRRFRPALSASFLEDEDIPAQVRSPEMSAKITAQRGPYFLSGNWWDEKSWGRVEWDLQLQNGEIVRCHESDPPTPSFGVARGTWRIDGIYD